VESVINRLLKPAYYRFTGEQEEGSDYLFESRGGMKVPFRGLSDGYRAFIGWVGDMLFHACQALPDDWNLDELQGVAMVDDIDLQLHPKWQLNVVPTVAKAFPFVQFILTSHSPLVAGSLEWMNILTLKLMTRSNQTHVKRFKEGIHGLDADQVLISDFFGLSSTRAGEKRSRLRSLTIRARRGDDEAARQVIAELAHGTEEELK
jgi:predicted ATP-binding protein involved in virulence